MLDGVGESALLARDASELIVRVNFVGVYLDGALETLARFFEFAALLMDQAEIVVSGSVRRIECRGFEVLFE